LKTIKARAGFDAERIEAIEKVVKHDIIAFLTSVNEKVGPDGRYIHMGLDLVRRGGHGPFDDDPPVAHPGPQALVELKKILRREALKHKKTVCMGRTHGIHAEPVTFGFKILVWYEEIKRHIDRVDRAIAVISVGRISGSVGTYIHLNPRVEVMALKKLGLKPAPVSTQVLQRDRHAEVIGVLALVSTSLEKFTLEVRHLQKSEVMELEEPFTKGQKGSSSMPHKKNPVRCERVAGLARLVRPTSRWPWRTSPSGMSGTSATPRPSGSSSPTPSS